MSDSNLIIAKLFKEEIEKPYYQLNQRMTPNQLENLFHAGFNSGMEYVIERLEK